MEAGNYTLTCKCGHTGPLTDFVQKGRGNNKRCLPCHKQKSAEYREKNRRKFNKKNWEYLDANPARRLFKAACTSSKRRGIERTINVEDIVIPDTCPYLGCKFQTVRRKNVRERYAVSIDRVDSSKGYIPGNVQVISYMANLMKSGATEQELINFAVGVLQMHKPNFLTTGATQSEIDPACLPEPKVLPTRRKYLEPEGV